MLETLTGISGSDIGSRSHDLTPFLAADTVVRFRIAAGYSSKSEYFYADNVQVLAVSNIAVSWTVIDNFGIIDAAKVTRSALQNAVSVSGTMLTTRVMVTELKDKDPENAAVGAVC